MSQVHRYYVFATAGTAADWVRTQFAALGDGGGSETDNCRTALVSAALPAGTVAYASSFAATDAMRTALLALVVPVGVKWYRVGAMGPSEGLILGTNSAGDGIPPVGAAFDLDDVLAAEGYGVTTVSHEVP